MYTNAVIIAVAAPVACGLLYANVRELVYQRMVYMGRWGKGVHARMGKLHISVRWG